VNPTNRYRSDEPTNRYTATTTSHRSYHQRPNNHPTSECAAVQVELLLKRVIDKRLAGNLDAVWARRQHCATLLRLNCCVAQVSYMNCCANAAAILCRFRRGRNTVLVPTRPQYSVDSDAAVTLCRFRHGSVGSDTVAILCRFRRGRNTVLVPTRPQYCVGSDAAAILCRFRRGRNTLSIPTRPQFSVDSDAAAILCRFRHGRFT
jgi:hypothetical protein